jgi:hypothetical protein
MLQLELHTFIQENRFFYLKYYYNEKDSTKYRIFLLLNIAFISCKKENHRDRDEVKDINLNVSVDAGAIYNLDLSAYGDADDIAIITKQASDFNLSEIAKQGTIGTYSYKRNGNPKAGGNGTDVVILKVSEPAGICKGSDETNITINFTIL